MARHNDLGKWGEGVAADYLEQQGYSILERGWRSGHKDIDLIAFKQGILAFVEVKTRKNNAYIQPQQAVDRHKIKLLMTAANRYICNNNIDAEIRFDIVAITGTDYSNYKIEHIEQAFLPIPY
ncbi:MAG: YraN family protein [Prevotella sp.]|nr:YraN family protein [Paraprevotella sp.]MCI6201350.1 YraN family protein [Paraprevotella sp.]MDD5855530.1 YraN family protein [Prevotella sp.]MDD7691897.1 YraN family protein [Prevotella sp.]MDY4407987.1 YraN family protein [Prevotella sp.]